MQPREVAGVAAAMALALGVGFLAGKRCTTPVEVPAEHVTIEVPGPERVIYECPPDAGESTRANANASPPSAKPSKPPPAKEKALPPTPAEITPLERQRLLSWVRDQSVDLGSCRGGSKETSRVSVTLSLDDEGRVSAVRFNAPPDELSPAVRSCFQQRMMQWTAPADLVQIRREWMFLLTL